LPLAETDGGLLGHSDFHKELTNAKDKNKTRRSKTISDYRIRQDSQEQGLFESYSHKKKFKKEAKSPKIDSRARQQLQTGNQTHTLPLIIISRLLSEGQRIETIQVVSAISPINVINAIIAINSKKRF
jgi:hypothetical protein